MALPLTYASLQTAVLAELAAAQPQGGSFTGVSGDARFQAAFPQAINDAEGRIYKDIPFLATRQVNTSLATIGGSNAVSLSTLSPAVAIPEMFSLLVSGARVTFDRTQFDTLLTVYPNPTTTVVPSSLDFQPRYWCLQDDHTIVYAPTADQAYTVELVGLFQQTTMSATQSTSYIGNTYPELLMAAVMVFMNGGYKQNFGAMVEDPKAAMAWEIVYQSRLASAKLDELRRRGLAPAVPVMPSAGKVQ